MKKHSHWNLAAIKPERFIRISKRRIKEPHMQFKILFSVNTNLKKGFEQHEKHKSNI